MIAENHKKAEELKNDKGFVFKVSLYFHIIFFFVFYTHVDICQVPSDSDGERKGIYKHPIIQKAINIMWFKNKQDDVRGHHSPSPITPVIPATSDGPQYIPPHKRLNLRQLLETRP